jgi:hypothetical protein
MCYTFAANLNMIKMKKAIGILSALIILSAFTLFAESDGNPVEAAPTAVVTGQVIDMATGEGLAGASITIDGAETKTFTDFDGRFRMNGLLPGKYDIKVSYISYEEVTIEQFNLTGVSETLKVKLASNGNNR